MAEVQDVRDAIAQCDLERLVKELARHAFLRMRRYRWRGQMDGSVPGGLTEIDFALDAIESALCGERRWNPDRHPNVTEWLRDVVSSKVFHAFESGENRTTIRAEEWTDRPLPPETHDILIELDGRLADDEELRRLLQALAEGYVKPADCAARLNLSVTEATNAMRRLRRWLQRHGYTEEVFRSR